MDTEIASRELDFFVSINGENVDIKTIEEVSDGIHITVSLNATPRSFFILPTFYQPVEFTNKLKFITIKLSSEHAKDQFIKLCRTAFYGCSSAAIEDLNLMCETFLNIVCTLFGICLLANEKDANEKTLIFSSNDLLFILKNNWGTLQTLFQRVLTRSFHPNNMYLQKLLSKYSSFQTLQTNLNNGLAWLVHGNIIKSVNSQTYILDIHQLHHNIIQRFPSEWVLSKQRLIPWIGMDMLNYENIRRDFIMESICAIKTNDVKKVRFLANANLHKLHKINENLAFLCKRYVKRPMEKIEDFRELSHRSMILMKITLKWIVKRLMWRRVRRFAYDFENLLEFPSPEAITVKYVKTADHHVVIVKNSQIQPIKQIHDRFFLDLKVL